MDVNKLAEDIAFALEDHKLIHWNQKPKTAEIVKSFVNEHLKKAVKEFYD